MIVRKDVLYKYLGSLNSDTIDLQNLMTNGFKKNYIFNLGARKKRDVYTVLSLTDGDTINVDNIANFFNTNKETSLSKETIMSFVDRKNEYFFLPKEILTKTQSVNFGTKSEETKPKQETVKEDNFVSMKDYMTTKLNKKEEESRKNTPKESLTQEDKRQLTTLKYVWLGVKDKELNLDDRVKNYPIRNILEHYYGNTKLSDYQIKQVKVLVDLYCKVGVSDLELTAYDTAKQLDVYLTKMLFWFASLFKLTPRLFLAILARNTQVKYGKEKMEWLLDDADIRKFVETLEGFVKSRKGLNEYQCEFARDICALHYNYAPYTIYGVKNNPRVINTTIEKFLSETLPYENIAIPTNENVMKDTVKKALIGYDENGNSLDRIKLDSLFKYNRTGEVKDYKTEYFIECLMSLTDCKDTDKLYTSTIVNGLMKAGITPREFVFAGIYSRSKYKLLTYTEKVEFSENTLNDLKYKLKEDVGGVNPTGDFARQVITEINKIERKPNYVGLLKDYLNKDVYESYLAKYKKTARPIFVYPPLLRGEIAQAPDIREFKTGIILGSDWFKRNAKMYNKNFAIRMGKDTEEFYNVFNKEFGDYLGCCFGYAKIIKLPRIILAGILVEATDEIMQDERYNKATEQEIRCELLHKHIIKHIEREFSPMVVRPTLEQIQKTTAEYDPNCGQTLEEWHNDLNLAELQAVRNNMYPIKSILSNRLNCDITDNKVNEVIYEILGYIYDDLVTSHVTVKHAECIMYDIMKNVAEDYVNERGDALYVLVTENVYEMLNR